MLGQDLQDAKKATAKPFYLAPASRSSPFAFQAKSFQQVSPLLLAGRPWSAVTGIWTNGDRVQREARVLQATFCRNLIPPPLRRWSSKSEKIRPVEWRPAAGGGPCRDARAFERSRWRGGRYAWAKVAAVG